ncbi:MAG: RT0821/Lpp0805 family surface protein [Rhizobiaceae bacterium]
MRRAQAKVLRGVMLAVLWRKFLPIAVLAALPMALAACASGNLLKRAETDRSIITGSIPSTPMMAKVTDEETIRNAVTSVDPNTLGPNGLAWTNPATGATGQITGLTEFQDGGHLCRRFSTSLARFDGVGLYHGEACLQNSGGWQLRAFASS